MQQIEQKHQATGEEVQRACGAALPLAAFLKVGCPAAETHRGLARSLSLAASASARVRHHERPSFQVFARFIGVLVGCMRRRWLCEEAHADFKRHTLEVLSRIHPS